jgi:hypothetical protein
MGQILRTHYKRPVYNSFLDASAYFSIECTAYDLWVKSTEIPLEQQILPMVIKEFKNFTLESLENYDKIISGCFTESRLKVIRKDAEKILTQAVDNSINEYPETVTTSLHEDNDQMIENEVEAAKMMDLENENEMETQAVLRPMSGTCSCLDFSLPTFPESNRLIVREIGGNDSDTLAWAVNLKKYLVDVVGFKMLSDVIGDQVYASTAFIKHFFGRNRSYVFYVLWLKSESNGPKAVIINSYEAQRAKEQLKKGPLIFGHAAWLMSPTGVLLHDHHQRPHVDKTILADILRFSGMTRILERTEWRLYFEKWLGDDAGRVEKSTIYRNIIIDPSEGKRALLGPLGSMLKVSTTDEYEVTTLHEYQKLNFLASNTKAIGEQMKRLSRTEGHLYYKHFLDMAFVNSALTGGHFKKAMIKAFDIGLNYLTSDIKSMNSSTTLDSEDIRKLASMLQQIPQTMIISLVKQGIHLLLTITDGEPNDTALSNYIQFFSKLLDLLPVNRVDLGYDTSISKATDVALEFLEFVLGSEFADKHFSLFLPLLKFDWRSNSRLTSTFGVIMSSFIGDHRSEAILCKFFTEVHYFDERDVMHRLVETHQRNPGKNLRKAILSWVARRFNYTFSNSFGEFMWRSPQSRFSWITAKDLLIESAVIATSTAHWTTIINVFLPGPPEGAMDNIDTMKTYVRGEILKLYSVDIDEDKN